MSRIGFFHLPWTGHLNPLAGLAHELQRRGHDVVFLALPDLVEDIRRRGFDCEVFGKRIFPAGTLEALLHDLVKFEGFESTRRSLAITARQSKALFEEAAPVIERAKLDLWLIDHLDYAAATLAAVRGDPFVSVIVGLMRHDEEGVPGFSGEPYSREPAVQEREQEYWRQILEATQYFRDFIGAFRIGHGLGPFSYDDLWSRLAQITQQPEEFEFPRRKLPACFHFTGPFALPTARPEVPFPWERLNGKPLVYACFGTILGRQYHRYKAVAQAMAGIEAQLVLSLGGGEVEALSFGLPHDAVVASSVPQLDILGRTELMITHGGMNSTLECLAAGVPMVAAPVTNDGPGIAARIEWTGTGVRVSAADFGPDALRSAILKVLNDPSFRDSARRFQGIIAERNGLRMAGDIVEQVLRTGRPVLRQDSPRIPET